jgi:uncharacterized paraquat-inducible protein A
MHILTPCPECGQGAIQPLAELVVNDEATCRRCGGTIDLTIESNQSIIREQSEISIKIKPMPLI